MEVSIDTLYSNDKSPCLGCEHVVEEKNMEASPCYRCAKIKEYQARFIMMLQPRLSFSDPDDEEVESLKYSLKHNNANQRRRYNNNLPKKARQQVHGPQGKKAAWIKILIGEGLRNPEIAETVGCSLAYVSMVRSGVKRKDRT